MAQLHKLKHGISMQGGIRTNSAPPTPLSKRRHRPPGYHRPRLPVATEMDDNSEDEDENGMTGNGVSGPRPIATTMLRKKARQRMEHQMEQNNNMGVGSL